MAEKKCGKGVPCSSKKRTRLFINYESYTCFFFIIFIKV